MLDPAHRAALQALARELDAIRAARFVAPIDAAAARMLLIHRWRRIVLRFDDPPFELLPQDAPLANPRRAVADAYLGVAQLAEAWMDGPWEAEGAMPEAAPAFRQRFQETVA
jgi:phenylacetic acid degradation operon negative regulatory protein